MRIDAIFSNVILYDLFYKITVKKDENIILVMDKPEEADDVFANADEVLSHRHQGTDIILKTLAVGTSKIRIMKDTTIVREVLIEVVDNIQRPASTLNVSLGQPEPK